MSDVSTVSKLARDKISDITSRIERLPLTSFQVKALVVVGVATFFDAFDAMTIAFALPVLIGAWSIKAQYIGFLISAGFLGQMIGAIFFGRLAERAGRLRITIITIFVYSVFSLCCAFSWSYTSLFVFRILQGFGLGGEVPAAATYINELVGAKNRGKFGMFFMVLFPMGLFMACLAGFWVVPNFGWRWLFVIGTLPAIIAFYLIWMLPESPRWLAGSGRDTEAEKAMTRIEKKVKKAYGAELPPAVTVPVAIVSVTTRFAELFRGIYPVRTIMVWVMWFAAFLANYGVTTWLPSIYKTVFKLPVGKSIEYSIWTMILGVIGPVITIVLIDKIGRRLLTGLLFLLGSVFFLVLWYLGASTITQVLVFASLGFFCSSSICTIVYVYTPELYPTRMRALGTSIATAWLRVASMVAPFFVGMMIAVYHDIAWAFFLYGGAAFIAGIVVLVLGVETKGKVLEEISP